jgi:hypothetical protein
MEINSVEFEYFEDEVEMFIVNGDILIPNGQGIEGIEAVHEYLLSKDIEVPPYSSEELS